MTDTVECADDDKYGPILAQEIVQVLFAFLTVALVVASRVWQVSVYFHPNLKSMLKFYHYSLIAYATAVGTIQLLHATSSVIFGSCDVLVSLRVCFFFRFVITAATMMFSLLMMAIPLERMLATLTIGRYETRNGSIGCISGALITLVSCVFSVVCHASELTSDRAVANCIFDDVSVVPLAAITAFLVMDGMSLCLLFALLAYNRYQLSRKTYSLSVEFQLYQNIRVLNLFLPNLLLHIFAYLWYTLGHMYIMRQSAGALTTLRPFVVLAICLPFYSFGAALLWLIVVLTERRRRRQRPTCRSTVPEKDVYFRSLQDQWSRPPPPRSATHVCNGLNTSRASVST